MDYLLRRLFGTGIRRGLAGGHWAWFVLAGAAFVLRRARRKEDPLVRRLSISPGQEVRIRLRDPSAPSGGDQVAG